MGWDRSIECTSFAVASGCSSRSFAMASTSVSCAQASSGYVAQRPWRRMTRRTENWACSEHTPMHVCYPLDCKRHSSQGRSSAEPVGHARGGVRDARRRKFRVAHLLRHDRRHLERICLLVNGGGSAEDERARSTDLRTPRERRAPLGRADAVLWRRACAAVRAVCRARRGTDASDRRRLVGKTLSEKPNS